MTRKYFLIPPLPVNVSLGRCRRVCLTDTMRRRSSSRGQDTFHCLLAVSSAGKSQLSPCPAPSQLFFVCAIAQNKSKHDAINGDKNRRIICNDPCTCPSMVRETSDKLCHREMHVVVRRYASCRSLLAAIGCTQHALRQVHACGFLRTHNSETATQKNKDSFYDDSHEKP